MTDDSKDQMWIELSEKKAYSRLLYPNPVVFLSTTSASTSASTSYASSTENVMVLSWLTACNNEGRFMFSLNKRRHSASLLRQSKKFFLSVPVEGMEELVLQVGGCSGRFGSKFGVEQQNEEGRSNVDVKNENMLSARMVTQVKRRKRPEKLVNAAALMSENEMFLVEGIEGTVARMLCEVHYMDHGDEDDSIAVAQTAPIIDEWHMLVVADVMSAFVKQEYWNPKKNQFMPQSKVVPPFLTFFGSQTFGYVSEAPLGKKHSTT